MTDERPNALTRRRLLAGGTAAALGPVLLGQVFPSVDLISADASSLPMSDGIAATARRMSVGYVAIGHRPGGNETGSADEGLAGGRLMAASRARAAGAAAVRGAVRVSVRIATPSMETAEPSGDESSVRGDLGESALFAQFTVPGDGVIRVPLWSCSQRPVQNCAAGTSMVLPSGGARHLPLSLETRRQPSRLLRRVRAALTDADPGAFVVTREALDVPARQGVYVLAAPDPRTGRLPRWEQLGFEARVSGETPVLVHRTPVGSNPVSWPYLVLTVEDAAACRPDELAITTASTDGGAQ